MIEVVICAVGIVTLTYFTSRPEQKRPKDKLTKELHLRGMPPQYPATDGAIDLNNPNF